MKRIVYLAMFFIGFMVLDVDAQCVKGNCYNGNGTFKFANGDVYDGQWKDGKMHGRGKYEFATGDRYEGDFHFGKREGSGIYVWASGGKYRGQWVADKRDGWGEFQWPTNATYRGYWKEDAIVNMDVSTVTDSQEKPQLGQ